MEGKKWWTSKTLWTNVLALGTTIFAGTFGDGSVAGIDLNGPNGVAIVTLLNVVLRWATDKKIVG